MKKAHSLLLVSVATLNLIACSLLDHAKESRKRTGTGSEGTVPVEQAKQPAVAASSTDGSTVAPTQASGSPQLSEQAVERAPASGDAGAGASDDELLNRALAWFEGQPVDPSWAPGAEAAINRSIAARLADPRLTWDSRTQVSSASCRTTRCRVELRAPPGTSLPHIGVQRLIGSLLTDLSNLGYKPSLSFGTQSTPEGQQIGLLYFSFIVP